ncbi:hypothetical protein P879_07531 [Paragonimus westermani]|uniref:Secreted protein n=1 Tax=Paragonimus westermani TaxID=34504 RepID=A0A8T0DLT9_9TREM|nr:hypothetical protein P879_07531 [Paragonimus westermani]
MCHIITFTLLFRVYYVTTHNSRIPFQICVVREQILTNPVGSVKIAVLISTSQQRGDDGEFVINSGVAECTVDNEQCRSVQHLRF